jgi:hypothetical protein
MSEHKTTDALHALRAEVWDTLDWIEAEYQEARTIRAELIRLADENKRMRGIIETLDVEGHRCAEKAEAELAEMKQSFGLRWRADMRAIDHWRREHPGDTLTWPDHADLCTWLMAELAALRAKTQWQPIETAPRDGKAFFWIVPKTAEETFQDTSGNLILSKAPPHWELCYFRGWNSLSKATHWMPLPEPPAKDNDNA